MLKRIKQYSGSFFQYEKSKSKNITKILMFLIPLILVEGILYAGIFYNEQDRSQVYTIQDEIILPKPKFKSDTSIEEALLKRKSTRKFNEQNISLNDLSQLLWAAQGITPDDKNRTAPSAGALYPLEIYVVSGRVNNLPPGVYKYVVSNHALAKIMDGDKRNEIKAAASYQPAIVNGAVDIVIAVNYKKIIRKYGTRGRRYAHLEAGHSAQNVYLQAVSLSLGTVSIGSFSDKKIKDILEFPEEVTPLYIMPVGKL